MPRTPFRSGLTLMLAVLMLSGGAAFAQPADGEAETIDLRPMWESGQQSRYRITQSEVTRVEVPQLDRSRESTTEFEVEVSWRVLEAAEGGGGTAEMVIEDMAMTVTAPNGESRRITANGGGEGTEQTQQWIGALTGKPLEVEVGPDGAVGSVEGYEAMRQAAGPLGENIDEAYCRELARDLAVMYSDGLRDAEPGDDWSHRFPGSHQLGSLQYTTDFTLRGVQRIAGVPVAMISTRSEIDFEAEIPDELAGSVDVRLADARQSGQVMFDLSRHEVVGANAEQMLEFERTRSLRDRELTMIQRETTNWQILRLSEE